MKRIKNLGALVCFSAYLVSPLSSGYSDSREIDEFLENKEQVKLTLILDSYFEFEAPSGETLQSSSDIPDLFREGDVMLYGYDKDSGTHLISPDGSKVYITVSNRYHPIDHAMDYCIQKYSSTAGTSGCIILATDCWRIETKRLNEVLLKQAPSPQITELLNTTQSEWMSYKTTLVKYYSELYNKQTYTASVLEHTSAILSIYKSRAMLQLRTVY